MVFKLLTVDIITSIMFENDVKEYGIQTIITHTLGRSGFENDVKEYGIQTLPAHPVRGTKFENDVKEYGIQTKKPIVYMCIIV